MAIKGSSSASVAIPHVAAPERLRFRSSPGFVFSVIAWLLNDFIPPHSAFACGSPLAS
jgi:hypothetical protein